MGLLGGSIAGKCPHLIVLIHLILIGATHSIPAFKQDNSLIHSSSRASPNGKDGRVCPPSPHKSAYTLLLSHIQKHPREGLDEEHGFDGFKRKSGLESTMYCYMRQSERNKIVDLKKVVEKIMDFYMKEGLEYSGGSLPAACHDETQVFNYHGRIITSRLLQILSMTPWFRAIEDELDEEVVNLVRNLVWKLNSSKTTISDRLSVMQEYCCGTTDITPFDYIEENCLMDPPSRVLSGMSDNAQLRVMILRSLDDFRSILDSIITHVDYLQYHTLCKINVQ